MSANGNAARRRAHGRRGLNGLPCANLLKMILGFALSWLCTCHRGHAGPTNTIPVRLGVDNAGSISYHEQIAGQHTWQTEAWFRGLKELGVGFVSTHFTPVLDGGTNNSALTRERLEELHKEFYKRHILQPRVLWDYTTMAWRSPDSWKRFWLGAGSFLRFAAGAGSHENAD